jgi:Protein of unknown function (DUF1592)/Protein of unknown function (DUF1588)/Protein of unknown function (DUF1595)/Protein of unknown function (DUF1587)/Protein of unknown function (DUF1585)
MTLRIASNVVALALGVGACTANISSPSGSGAPAPGEPGYVPPGSMPGPTGGGAGTTGSAGTGGGSSSMPPAIVGVTDPGIPADPQAAGPMPLRRLTHREYNNTVRDLLGVTTNPADAFPLDLDAGFLFHRAGLVSTLDASTLRDAAEALAKGLDIAKLLPCSPASGEDACAQSFIQSFGAQAYRRPVAADEAARLTALFKTARTTMMLDFNESIRVVVEAIVQSPGFLYRWELGQSVATLEGQVAKLTPYEVASRLSYFLWRSMPDKALFTAAARGGLQSADAVAEQARRLLADPKAQATVSAFFDEWLGLEELPERPKDAKVYPEFGEPLANAMLDENHAFINNVLFHGDATFMSLMTGTASNVSAGLAPIYGAASGALSLDPAQRAGLMTRVGFLTLTGSPTGSHPVKRGRKVYERFLCGVLPPPPNNVPPAKPASAGGTTRQRFEEHDMNPCAQGCHSLMDPLGFPFEHYDGIGRYRMQDNGLPVDSSTNVDLDGASHPVKDAIELSQLLAQSPTAQGCFTAQWARFAWVRDAVEADRFSIQSAQTAFSKSGFKVPEMLVSVASSRSFLYRSLAEGEARQ